MFGQNFAPIAVITAALMCMLFTVSHAAVNCLVIPKHVNCVKYVYPAAFINADLQSLCTDMPFMSACSLRTMCNKNANKAVVGRTPVTCDPFTLLATTCRVDNMSKMKGCARYVKMCVPGSRVKQCVSRGLTYLPTTMTSNNMAKSICEEMPDMKGCTRCTWMAGRMFAMCDLLSVYGQLCFDMPTHSQCSFWKTACAADPKLFICRLQNV